MGPNKLYAQAIYGSEPTTMDELGPAIIQILNQHSEIRISGKNRIESPKTRCVGLSWDLTHHDHVSNSHSGPEGFPQNFMRKEGVPTGYPGWSGRVWVRYVRQDGYSFGSDPFRRALFHTGTGGGGSYNGPWEQVSHLRYKRYGHQRGANMYPEICCFSWDCRMYDSDWPDITANLLGQYEKECMWATLNDKPLPSPLKHRFLWEDPDTKAADLAFIQECSTIKTLA